LPAVSFNAKRARPCQIECIGYIREVVNRIVEDISCKIKWSVMGNSIYVLIETC
jgi:hypothetical protein